MFINLYRTIAIHHNLSIFKAQTIHFWLSARGIKNQVIGGGMGTGICHLEGLLTALVDRGNIMVE